MYSSINQFKLSFGIKESRNMTQQQVTRMPSPYFRLAAEKELEKVTELMKVQNEVPSYSCNKI